MTNLSPDQRQALREKHHVGQNEGDDQCQSCYSADGYPCDVIKVLDWAEQAYDDGWKACDFQWREL